MRPLETYEISEGVMTSRLPGFHNLSIDERIEKAATLTGLSEVDVDFMKASFTPYFPREQADKYIENCIAGCDPPMGVATNALINGVEYLIPMRAEEPSIVAAASRGFLYARKKGIQAASLGNSMIGQILITDIYKPYIAVSELADKMGDLLTSVNQDHQHTKAHGYNINVLDKSLDVQILVYTADVQGANVVNQMCEKISGPIAEITHGEVITSILSNYADQCIAKAVMRVPISDLARPELEWDYADEVCNRILKLAEFANTSIHRATTNNKGIMNGVIAVANATGQDTRALEAGAHSYSLKQFNYSPLANWYVDSIDLVGELQIPIAVGTVRGATGLPFASLGLKILGNPSATELQEILVSVGLANNFAALHTLVTDGINRGHLALHNKRFLK